MVTSPPAAAGPVRWTRYWPFAVGGLAGPLAAAVFARSIPFVVAVGGCNFAAWAIAHWLFQRTSVRPIGAGRRLGNSIVTGLAGGLVAGLLAFLFPWN